MKTLRNLMMTLLMLIVSQSAMAWGAWGHHIAAYIAEKHLTPEAKAKCQYYLKYSLPHYSSWQDYWRFSDPFKETSYWHSSYVDKDFKIVGYKGDVTRDAAYQVDRLTKEMIKGQYKNMPDSIVEVNLKLLIHTVGDMHCPCHIGYSKEHGLRGISMYVKGKKYSRHKFWDASPNILHPKWKADNFLEAYDTYSPRQIKKICKGTPLKWGEQNARKMVKTFYYWDKGAEFKNISKEQRQNIDDTVHEQLAFAGYRLAGILNKIFSK